MNDYGLTAGKKATLVTETYIITCTIQNVRLRDPCATGPSCDLSKPYKPSVECMEQAQTCSQETLVAPSDSGRCQPEPACCDPCSPCTPTPPKAGPCADLPCEPCHEPDPCCAPVVQTEPCCECITLQRELAEQATERLDVDEFEVALETGVAIKRNA